MIDVLETYSKAGHLVEAARELLDEAAAIVPDEDVSDALRECVTTTVDPLLSRIEASRQDAGDEMNVDLVYDAGTGFYRLYCVAPVPGARETYGPGFRSVTDALDYADHSGLTVRPVAR